MATYTAVNLADGVLSTGSLTDLFTVAALTTEVIKAMTVTNPTGAAIAMTLKLLPRTGGTARTLVSAVNVPAGATFIMSEALNHVCEAGGKLQLQGNGLEYVVSSLRAV